MIVVNLLAACVLDGILGDPRWLPHPIRLMGAFVNWCEPVVRSRFVSGTGRCIGGSMLALFVAGMSFLVAWGVLEVAFLVHPWFGHLLWIVLGYTTLAAKDLTAHAWAVYSRLQAGSVNEARDAVACMVGRDTDRLTESEIAGATVESVAESTSDGVIAPLFYLVIGGPPLALAYKAVNTLDSMIGHREAPYGDIGWASAKLDDLMNVIPARLSARLLVLSSCFHRAEIMKVWRIYRRDCAKHASPNSGHPEAAMAGALGVRLGGSRVYQGIRVDRPQIGDPANVPQARHIPMAIELMWLSFGMAIVLGLAFITLWNGI